MGVKTAFTRLCRTERERIREVLAADQRLHHATQVVPNEKNAQRPEFGIRAFFGRSASCAIFHYIYCWCIANIDLHPKAGLQIHAGGRFLLRCSLSANCLDQEATLASCMMGSPISDDPLTAPISQHLFHSTYFTAPTSQHLLHSTYFTAITSQRLLHSGNTGCL
jgi:hypothetical protein